MTHEQLTDRIFQLLDGLNNNQIYEIIDIVDEYIKEHTAEWVPVNKGLPEEKTNPNTHDFEEVLCSTTFGDVRAYKFGTPYGWEKPHFWRGLNVMDEYVLAWMEKPEPWKGEQHGQTG